MQIEKTCGDHSYKKCDKSYEHVDIIDPELKAMIEKIAKKEKLTTYKLIVNKIPPDGSSYLGVLTEVTVLDTLNNNHLNLFVKSILPNAEQLKMISLPDAYCKEIYFYLELSKVLEELQIKAQIPLEERYKFVKSYNCDSTTHHIIMENMCKKGFTVWNRFDVISLDYAKKAIKLLAKFHALGFVLHEKKPKYYKEKIVPLRFPFKYDEGYYKFYTNMGNNAASYLKGSARMKLRNIIPPLFKKGDEYTNNRDSTLTICHGDFRSNNILIKMGDKEITDMVPVDYQVFYHGSPLIDLLYFIFGSTDRQFRRKHLDYLKNLYYATMKQFLKYFDMDVQKYYPEEEYERHFKERLDFGLFTGVWYLQSNLAKVDSIMDYSKKQVSEADFGRNDLAKLRMQELVDEFIEWGYL